MILRLLRHLVSANVMMTLEYRGAFLIYMINTVTGPVVSLLVWLTVGEQGVELPYGRSQFVTYYLMASVVAMLTNSWLGSFLAEGIRLGDLSPWLLRPMPYILTGIGNNIGEKIVKLPLLLPLVGIVALFFRDDLDLPTELGTWLLFMLSIPLAASIAFLLDFVIGLLAFWIQDVNGLLRVKALVGAFLAGQFMPLALFPRSLAGFLEVQPFRFILSFPIEVLIGQLTRTELIQGFVMQMLYCVGLWACYRLLWHFGLRSYAAAGA